MLQLLVIFDADMVCSPEFFTKIVAELYDPQVALVLTPQVRSTRSGAPLHMPWPAPAALVQRVAAQRRVRVWVRGCKPDHEATCKACWAAQPAA